MILYLGSWLIICSFGNCRNPQKMSSAYFHQLMFAELGMVLLKTSKHLFWHSHHDCIPFDIMRHFPTWRRLLRNTHWTASVYSLESCLFYMKRIILKDGRRNSFGSERRNVHGKGMARGQKYFSMTHSQTKHWMQQQKISLKMSNRLVKSWLIRWSTCYFSQNLPYRPMNDQKAKSRTQYGRVVSDVILPWVQIRSSKAIVQRYWDCSSRSQVNLCTCLLVCFLPEILLTKANGKRYASGEGSKSYHLYHHLFRQAGGIVSSLFTIKYCRV